MKRIFAFVLCCILAITLIGCAKTITGTYYSDDNEVSLGFRPNGILEYHNYSSETTGKYEIKGDQALMNNGYVNLVGTIKGDTLIIEIDAGKTLTLTKK